MYRSSYSAFVKIRYVPQRADSIIKALVFTHVITSLSILRKVIEVSSAYIMHYTTVFKWHGAKTFILKLLNTKMLVASVVPKYHHL